MIKKAITFLKRLNKLDAKLDYIQQSLGRIENRQLTQIQSSDINDYEFKVYSQSGEDGIIQYLVNNISLPHKIFVEFGVEDYKESNTRFLALNNQWSGLVIDGDINNINTIKRDPIYWRCNIKAEHSFITKDNINALFQKNGIEGDIGLLSIDIDGNDYWVFKAIDDSVKPAIIIAEYNSFFGPEKEVTVPYDPQFVRSTAHFSQIYYGASISALNTLANKRGYKLVASNKAGNNVFFVRNDLLGSINELSIKEAYREISFREVHNENGELLYLPFNEAKKIIDHLSVIDVQTEAVCYIKDL